ncbi:hypothetical protein BT63DRAFT_424367 [Microthyrium microscopicum]|uniref:Zn(2)-C6 fungal-type domain-containing protein n=1 Tax=Microthyrium microscopicum TaxID=703497 RepID=A0A6A6UE31_9PEZI|nr:hypothetical protein BT63DRAFT_424367 [Microthyrium microscopicum]
MASKAPAFQVISLVEGGGVRDYKRRKAHKKTRAGCLTCKVKKVKCDEKRPVCQRCGRNGRVCNYDDFDGREQEHALVRRNSGATIGLSLPFSDSEASSINITNHLQNHCTEIVQIPGSLKLLSLARSYPVLQQSLLAVAACHLRQMAPTVRQHQIDEKLHLDLALQSYQSILYTPKEKLCQSDVDCVMLCTTLFNVIAFTLSQSEDEDLRDLDPENSWVFSPRKDRLSWMALQAGIHPLLRYLSPFMSKTMEAISPLFLSPGELFMGVPLWLYEPPKTWIGAFGIDSSDSTTQLNSTSDLYRAPVSVIAWLRTLPPVGGSLFQHLSFLGKIQPRFRYLLYDRDERALWLFGYWLGLMSRFATFWWCHKHAKRDHKAIGMWLGRLQLTERVGTEGETWKELMSDYNMAPHVLCA